MWGIIATWRMAREGCEEAAAGLARGDSAADAIERAVREVEDVPYYKSVGYGGLPNEEMEVELDAAFMDGDTLEFGAVGALKNFANPVSVARSLARGDANNLLVGAGAEKFADKMGFERRNMLTDRAKALFARRLAEEGRRMPGAPRPLGEPEAAEEAGRGAIPAAGIAAAAPRAGIDREGTDPCGHDTVGMVCLDASGSMAAATSTSGLFMKRPGRVGDSPVPGAGFYVDSAVGGAVSTGLGEDVMKGCLGYEIVRLMEEGLHPQRACELAVHSLSKKLAGRRGHVGDISFVAMDARGRWGAASNIEGFSFVVATEGEPACVRLVHPRPDGTCAHEIASPEWQDEYMRSRMAPFGLEAGPGPLRGHPRPVSVSQQGGAVANDKTAARERPCVDPVLEERILAEVDGIADEMVEAVRAIVRQKSVRGEPAPGAPFGPGVRAALDQALALARELGFATTDMDGYVGYASWEPAPRAGGGPVLPGYVCAIGHLDVVPEGEAGWKVDPYSGHLADGRITGRGVLDNKGPIYSCLFALSALKRLGLAPRREVRIIFGCNEETGFDDLRYYLEREPAPEMGFTPDCKYPVVYAERGRMAVRLAIPGAGAGGPEASLDRFLTFVNEYVMGANPNGERFDIDFADGEFGATEVRDFALARSEGSLAVEFSISYPAGITAAWLEGRLSAVAADRGLSLEVLRNCDPVRFERDCPLVRTLAAAYERVTGEDGTPVTTTGGTYAKLMPNIVPFGPSFPGQRGIGHQPMEWMDVSDIVTNAKIYALSLYLLSR